jgi:hypothetical protein
MVVVVRDKTEATERKPGDVRECLGDLNDEVNAGGRGQISHE